MKDSDVTWLYGPLHTAVDWAPPPKPKPDPTSVDDKDPASAQDRLDLSIGSGMKPILKHRSICELLTSDLPSGSPLLASLGSDEDKRYEDEDELWLQDEDLGDSDEKTSRSHRERPPLLHTKSDTHITRWASRAFRRDSPPRILAENSAAGPAVSTPGSTVSGTSYISGKSTSTMNQGQSGNSGSEQDTTGSSMISGRKKHISFNTFVEQCIAIEKPEGDAAASGAATPKNNLKLLESYDDGSVYFTYRTLGRDCTLTIPLTFYRYDEDSEDGSLEDEEDDGNGLFAAESTLPPDAREPPLDSNSVSDSDEEEDDEVLEIRTANTSFRPRPNSGRSPSSSSSSGSSRSRNSAPLTASNRRNSSQRIRFNSSVIRTPSSEKELITIAPIAPTILKTKGVGNGSGAEDDDYDYPLTKTNDAGKWYGTGADVPVHLVYVPPIGGEYRVDGLDIDGSKDVFQHREAYFSVGSDKPNGSHVPSVGVTPASPAATGTQGKVFLGVPVIASPADDDEEDAYDYFGGPDLGEAFAEHKPHSYANRREVRDDDSSPKEGAKLVKYAEGGAASVVGGRSSGNPQVVVAGVKGAIEDGRGREHSRSRSRSRTPSPSEISVPSNAPSIPPPSAAVAVPGASSSHNSSHPISPPTPSSSNAFLTPPDMPSSRGRSAAPVTENQPRGRSATRGSSFSDRERSSSRGTNSPIGSISPEGSAVGIAIGSAYGVYANGRDRDAGKRGNDRVRDRLGKRQMSDSLSPDDGRTSSVSVVDGQHVTSSGSTTSNSSGSSTVTPTPTTSGPLRIATDTRPPPIEEGQEEEQLRRSRQPTPASSPVLNMKAPLPIQVPPPQPSTPSTTVPPSAKGIVSRNVSSPPSSPTGKALDEGTLVGRAVEMAGAFLGSIWHSNGSS